MATVRISMPSHLAPEAVLAAGYDFSARRAQVFPAVSTEHLEVHSLNPGSAYVTEGTPVGIGVNWERCHYDWSRPGEVIANVVDSNVYAPQTSQWILRATPKDGGSRIEMIWVREFRPGTRGRIFGALFRLAGNRIFTQYARQVMRNLEAQETSSA